MLFISDKVDPTVGANKILKDLLRVGCKGEVDIFEWMEHEKFPRVSDYEILVLDMEVKQRYGLENAFYGLRQDVESLLDSGGVIICLNYFTVSTTFTIHYVSDKSVLEEKEVILSKKINHARMELNYDWIFSDKWLSNLNVAQLDAKKGANFVVKTKNNLFLKYFSKVGEYHKTLNNVLEIKEADGTPTGKYKFRLGLQQTFDTDLLAVSKVTGQPIACKIGIGDGTLIFLPQSKDSILSIICQLYDIGKAEYENNKEKEATGNAPDWLLKYRSEAEVVLDKEIARLDSAVKDCKLKHKHFDQINYLLYGTGEYLEKAVQLALTDMGFKVEVLEKGYTMDLKATIDEKKFVIEVTGIDDRVYKDNKHFGHILQYLPLMEENEKIIFLANTYRNVEIEQRIGKEHFTSPVLRLSNDNGFCLMQTVDLFSIWKDKLVEKPIKNIFSRLYTCKGEFKLSAQ
jgi:hypothetical protein